MYFNYHAKARRLIEDGHLVDCVYQKQWNAVSPALVLFFDNARPMPIRPHRWAEYLPLIARTGVALRDCDGVEEAYVNSVTEKFSEDKKEN